MANLLDQLLSITGLKAPATGGSDSIYRDDGSTGVEKYLARQAEEIQTTTAGGGSTGVAKYLDKQQKVTAPSASAKPASGVDKYLQKQPSVKKKSAAVTKKASKPVAKKAAPAKKQAPAKKAKPKPAAAAPKKAASKASGVIDISVSTRCQAGTAKGTQCKRTSQLTQIQRAINKQKYKVTVCSQHDNSSFKPYDGLIKN